MRGEWINLNNEDLNDLYFSPNIFRLIKSKRMRWVNRVVSMGKVEVHTGFWLGNRRERDYLEDPAIDWRVLLSRSLRKWDGDNGPD